MTAGGDVASAVMTAHAPTTRYSRHPAVEHPTGGCGGRLCAHAARPKATSLQEQSMRSHCTTVVVRMRLMCIPWFAISAEQWRIPNNLSLAPFNPHVQNISLMNGVFVRDGSDRGVWTVKRERSLGIHHCSDGESRYAWILVTREAYEDHSRPG